MLHRDIKLDNVLLEKPGTKEEIAILSDFGMSFDLHKNRVSDYKILPYDGFRRGGAPATLAPEVSLPQIPHFMDYSKNDE